MKEKTGCNRIYTLRKISYIKNKSSASKTKKKKDCSCKMIKRNNLDSISNFRIINLFLLSLRVFGLLSSSLSLFPQRFGRYVLRPSSGVCRTWLTESKQATPVDSIKDVVQSSAKVPEFDKHLKKAGGYIGRNVVEITIKMKTIARKPLMIKIIKLRLRNLDNYLLF